MLSAPSDFKKVEVFYREIYWWPAICLLIFVDKIDKVVKADKRFKKVILVFSAKMMMVCVLL